MEKLGEIKFREGTRDFLEVNKKYWENEPNILSGDNWIYVLHTARHEFMNATLENVVAKGLQAREHLPIISILTGKTDSIMELANQLDDSFGIEHKHRPSYHDYNSIEIEQLSEKWACDTYGDKEALFELTYRNVKIGNAIYDEILRRGINGERGEVFDFTDITRDQYRIYLRNALAEIDQAYEIFQEKKPRYLVLSEFFYIKGLYASVASVLGANIIVTRFEIPDVMVEIDSSKQLLTEVVMSDIIRVQREKCLMNFDMADVDKTANLFVEINKNQTIEPFPIPVEWQNRKNIFILPHAFGDSPRECCRHTVYHDYCEWYLDTLRIIKDIPDVNWIIKDHPCAAYYGQEEFVYSAFKKNKTNNMYWLDKEFDGMRIKDIADCVLTCAGTAGIEYWAYGVPTIMAASTYYGEWGIAYQIKSISDYELVLKNIQDIQKPSEQSAAIARKALVAYADWCKHWDEFSKIFSNFCTKEATAWRENGNFFGTDETSDEKLAQITGDFCNEIVFLLKKSNWKLSTIYQLKYLCKL